MDKRMLLTRYEIRGEERDYLEARPLYERALAEGPSASLLVEYGYLLESHARLETRRAVELYRRAIELDARSDKARYQLIHALGALGDGDEMITLYRKRVAAAPEDVRERRFLAASLLTAGRADGALAIIEKGLAIAPDDRALIALRGKAKAIAGDSPGALADWRRAVQLDGSDIGPLYESAYLLERDGQVDQALETWQEILEWNDARGGGLEAELPARELARLRRRRGTA
jgi:tetratricopeptide (TPR) repeat protein